MAKTRRDEEVIEPVRGGNARVPLAPDGTPDYPTAPTAPVSVQSTTPGLGPRAPVVAVDPSVSGAGFTVNPMKVSPLRSSQAQTPVTPGLGPRAPVAPPVAVDPSVSGAGFTVNPLNVSPLRSPQAQTPAAPVAPVAEAPVSEDAFNGRDADVPAGGANAGRAPVNSVQGSSMAMTSPAALNLAEIMAMGRADAYRNQHGGKRYDINGIEAQKLRAKWADAARQAFLGAMSPEQRKRFEAEEAANAMRKSALYSQTPEAMEAEAGRKRDIEVAKEAGAAARERNSLVYEGMKLRAALKREELALRAKGDAASLEQADRLAARQEELQKTLSTDERKDKLADREEARRARMLDSIGRRIDKLSENAGDEKVDKRIAELQAEYDKLAGVGGEQEQQGQRNNAVAERAPVRAGAVPLASAAFKDGAMMTKGGRTYKRTNGVWVAQ